MPFRSFLLLSMLMASQCLDFNNGSLSQSWPLTGYMSFFLGGEEEGKQSKWKLLLALWKHRHPPNKNITICWKAHGLQNCIWVQNWVLILVWPGLWSRLIYFLLFLIIYWRLFALQFCIGFCHTIMQIYIYIYPLPFLLSLSLHSHSTPPGHHRVPG